MDYDSLPFKQFMAETREKASLQLKSMNVGQEFKDVLASLLKIVDSTEALIKSGQGQSADVRVLKAKFDKTKTDLFQTNKKLESFKKEIFSSISEEILSMSKDLKVIQKNPDLTSDSLQSLVSLQNSLKNIVNQVADLTKTP